jgi:dihydroorotase
MMLTLVQKGELELEMLVNASAILPAKVLGINAGIQIGQAANLVIVDTTTETCYSAEKLISTGKNSPVLGETLVGEVKLTMSGGREVFRA